MTGTAASCLESGLGQRNPVLSATTRLSRAAASFVAVSMGVALLLRAELGVAPYDVLNTGIADTFGIPFGVAFLVTSAVFYGTGILLGGRTGWASLVGTFVIAPLIQGSLAVIPETERMVARLPMFGIGVGLLALGVCLVISTELGPGPGEVFMLGLIARRIPVTYARWVTDGLCFALGLALGGAIGLGTVVFAFAFGPLVAAGLRALRYTPPVNIAEAVVAP